MQMQLIELSKPAAQVPAPKPKRAKFAEWEQAKQKGKPSRSYKQARANKRQHGAVSVGVVMLVTAVGYLAWFVLTYGV